MLGVALAALPLSGFICDDDNDPIAGKGEGTERWIVHLKGAPADLAAYRLESKKGPSERAKAAAEVRKLATKSHADFAKKLSEAGGEIVEHWWMTHAVTIEIPAGTSSAISDFEGVARIAPDLLLE